MSPDIPRAFSKAKEKLEDKHNLRVTIANTGTLIVKREEDGDVMDYMEIRDDGVWAWESERDLPVSEDEGELNEEDRAQIITKVEEYVLP